MNRIVFILFLVATNLRFCMAQENGQAVRADSRDVVFGLRAGVNFSRFSASINSEPKGKAGLALGMYLRKQIGDRSFFRPELYYSNQGQKDNYGPMVGGGPSTESTTTTMHYLNIPVLFEFGGKMTFQVGPQIGVLLSGREKGTISGEEVDEKLDDVMTALDLGLVLGAGYSLTEQLEVGVRINYGLSNIYTPDQLIGMNFDFPEVRNRVLQVYLGYSF